jgi:uncharacterized spore protein YtfJ
MTEERTERRRRMEAEVRKLLEALADLREKADVNACFGEPVAIEGRTVVPVAKVAYGFAVGIGRTTEAEERDVEEAEEEAVGEADDSGGSGVGGGGVLAQPFAVVEVTPEGTRVEAIIDEQKVTLAAGLLAGWAVFWLARALTKIFGRQA